MCRKTLFKVCMPALVATVFLSTTEADAFCIYNYSSHPIHFEQVANSDGGFMRNGMEKVIAAKGGKECCNWQNKDCNPGGKKSSMVYFSHAVSKAPTIEIHNYRCNEQWKPLEMQAGGWAEIYDNPGSRWGLSCVVYRAN